VDPNSDDHSARAASRFAGAARALLNWRFGRFLVTGAVNTAFGYGVFYLMLRLVVEPILALTLATIIGVLFNFVSYGRVVFDQSDPRLIWRFALVYVVAYAYNAAGLLALGAAGVAPAIAGLLLLPGAVAISWTLNRRFVFAPRVAPCA